jgi:hypothetical protein
MIEPDWAITMHMWPMPEKPKGPPDGVTVVDVDRPVGRPGPRARRPPPPPPPGWTGPPPAGKGPDDIIIIEDNSTLKSSKKKTKRKGSVLGGLFGGDNASIKSAKKPKKKRGVLGGLFNGKTWKRYARKP